MKQKGSLVKIKILAVNFIILIILLICLELICWAFFRRLGETHNGATFIRKELNLISDSTSSIISHPYLLYCNNPRYFENGKKKHNKSGYRNRYEIKKNYDTNITRILLLGGSTTYGYLNPNLDDTWGYKLETALNQI